MRLVAWANERNGTAFVLPPTKKTERVGKGKLLPKSRLNPAMMDIAYADEPHSCSEDVCKILLNQFEFRGRQSLATGGTYKYVLDVSTLVDRLVPVLTTMQGGRKRLVKSL